MKKFLLVLLFPLYSWGAFFSGHIDASSANITTTYVSLVTMTAAVDGGAFNNATGGDVFLCFSSSTIGGCTDDKILKVGQGMAVDLFPFTNVVFVKSASGTITTGDITAMVWKK